MAAVGQPSGAAVRRRDAMFSDGLAGQFGDLTGVVASSRAFSSAAPAAAELGRGPRVAGLTDRFACLAWLKVARP